MALVQVTPENAALWGFDRIGQTINTETGGIVNPFEGAADGFNRDARNTEVQRRATATPNYVAPGYEQIMSDPRNRAFNQQLLGDSQFAWNNLQQGFGNQVDGNNPMLFYNGTGPSAPTNPLTSRRTGPPSVPIGTGTNPIGSFRFGTGGTQTTNQDSKIDPLAGGSTAGVTQATGQNVSNPLGGTPSQQSTSAPAYSNATADTGQGLFAVGDPSKTGGSAFQSTVPGVQKTTAEYAPGREGVVNAMTKRFDAKKWF